MLIASTTNEQGKRVEAEWTEGEKVVITVGGAWVGEGTLRYGEVGTDAAWTSIEDCAAVLGDDVYDALERGLANGLAKQPR